MNIKKVDDKPMVIHTKEQTRIHVKVAPETMLKGRNVLTVDRSPKVVGAVKEGSTDKNDRKKSAMKIGTKGEVVRTTDKKISGKDMRGKDHTSSEKRSASENGKGAAKEAVGKTVQKENSGYAQYHRTMQEKENGTVGFLASVGAKTALEQVEGGNEVYVSYLTARNLFRPVESATDAGRRLYRTRMAKAKEKHIKRVQAGKKISKKAVRESTAKVAKETSKAAAKKAAKETAKAAVATAGTAAGGTVTGPGGFLIGAAAGEVAGIAIDKRDVQKSTRNRMIQLFVAKLRQEENQDSIGKALKDIVLMRFSMMAKYIIRYVGLVLLALFALVALMVLPIIAVIAIIYNSPFAIFFPSISSGDTTQDVLSAYVAEFNQEVNEELTNHSGYDTSEKIYMDFEGAGEPDNYCDILYL